MGLGTSSSNAIIGAFVALVVALVVTSVSAQEPEI